MGLSVVHLVRAHRAHGADTPPVCNPDTAEVMQPFLCSVFKLHPPLLPPTIPGALTFFNPKLRLQNDQSDMAIIWRKMCWGEIFFVGLGVAACDVYWCYHGRECHGVSDAATVSNGGHIVLADPQNGCFSFLTSHKTRATSNVTQETWRMLQRAVGHCALTPTLQTIR